MGWTAGVLFLAGARDFSVFCSVQTGSEAHPASYPMGTRGSFPQALRGQGMKLTTYLHLVQWSRIVELYNIFV
jgi:hypothetical protein